MNSPDPERKDAGALPSDRRPSAGLRSFLQQEFVRAGIYTYAFSGLTLLANLVSGVATARALGIDGRGEAVAILVLVQSLGFLFAMGCMHTVSYRYARQPQVAARLATTWTLLLVPLSLAAFALGQLVLPVLFDSQSAATVDLARVYLVMVALILWNELTNGLLLGARDYLFANAMRFAQPALYALALAVLWRFGELTVESTLASAVASFGAVQLVAMARVLRNTGGFARPDLRLGVETLWYGFRGHGAFLANAMNQRLDLVIMPAFISAAGLGLYSIAANLSLIVSTLAHSFAGIVLPQAARDPERGPRIVLGALQAALAIAAVAAVAMGAFARPALELVYGSSFGDAAPALRVLLPGTAVLAGALILVAGLYAANRPSIATGVQVAGLAVTLVGLLVLLPGRGIMTAAVVSTGSYAVVFLAALLAYKRVVGLRWSAFVSPPGALRAERTAAKQVI